MADVYTVEEVYQGFKDLVKTKKSFSNIQVTGEISNFKVVRDNLYFTIKDNIASLSAVCWKFTDRFNINLNNGDKIILTGSITISKINSIQITVTAFQKVDDIGDIYKEYIIMKTKFEQLGYFDKSNKKPLPTRITNIGIITAKDGAALQDVLYVLKSKRFRGIVNIKGCVVQGVNCELSVKKSIEYFDDLGLDIILITRGGGSYEDLYGFSRKKVVKAIHRAKTCIISAVGHEVDTMLSDYVADVRAPTPSVAGEMIVQVQQYSDNTILIKYKNYLKELYFRIKSVIGKIDGSLVNPQVMVSNKLEQYMDYVGRLRNTINYKMLEYRDLLNKCEIIGNSIQSNSKSNIMKNGYVQLYNGTINVSSVDQLNKLKKKYGNKKQLKLKLCDGTATICISNITINDK